ncbi:hypothetical protein F511_08320 [Dorcoceras hygrometricum]|uniref:Uncharacterized protein n=1 Tax=Dorcoceras hygrometricum TaxID=472368 RepID=A0A2Z7D9A6_9LAMI|nr:hypothetical protein F511_08320 [Dorcoceras hygrometricum]
MESGLKGFLGASDSIYEEAVIEFFANAKDIAGTIVSLVGTRKIATTKDMFANVFGLPSEGLTSFLNILEETVTEMRSQFSGSDEPFRAPKKKGMKIEFCMLHDVVAKVLCSKAALQYGPFNPYIPNQSTTIGKSRVAKDPIAMHTSWRSNSDIASVTSIGYPRMSASGESSTTMHRLLHASGSHPIPPPNDPK